VLLCKGTKYFLHIKEGNVLRAYEKRLLTRICGLRGRNKHKA
jgi:hypothetical protein